MPADKKFQWYKIAEAPGEIHFTQTGLLELEVAGKKVCLVKDKNTDEISACAAKCPHAGGAMAEGYLDASGNIVCPVHRYKFDPGNGRNISGEGYYLGIYPIQTREDGVYIGIEENKLFGWLK